MSPAIPSAARSLGVLAATAGLLATAACGASLSPQTYAPRDAANGGNGAVRDIAVRNVAVVAPTDPAGYPAGADAPVQLSLVNAGSVEDHLVGASSDAAAQVVLLTGGTPAQRLTVPPGGAAAPGGMLVLHGLTKPLRSGEYVVLHLQFDVSGSGDVSVPVATATGAAAVQATAPAPSETPTP